MAGVGQELAGLIGGAAGAPQDPGMSAGQAATAPTPVTDPNEIKKNTTLWEKFLASAKDPNVKQALMMTGLQMLKSPGYGQSGFDVASNALGTGVMTLQQLRDKQKAEEIAAAERVAVNRREDAKVSNDTTRTGNDTARTGIEDKRATNENQYRTGVLEQGAIKQVEDTRHNKAFEANDRTRAFAELTRARTAAAGGGKTPQDIQKIDMLSKHFQSSLGVSKEEADAKAVLLLETQARSKTPGDQVMQLVAAKTEEYNKFTNPWGDKPPTAEMRAKWVTDAQNEVLAQRSFNEQVQNTPSAAPAAGGAPGYLDNQAPTITVDPVIAQKVDQLKARGTNPNAIREALIREKVDPKIYGY